MCALRGARMAGASRRLPPRETRAGRRTAALVSAEEGAAEVVTSGRSRDIHFATLRGANLRRRLMRRKRAPRQRRAASAPHTHTLGVHTSTHTRAGCRRNVGSTNGRSSRSQRKRSAPGDNVVSAGRVRRRPDTRMRRHSGTAGRALDHEVVFGSLPPPPPFQSPCRIV
ncbi:hypothetical protein MTO96_013288 [Rhipicephalus appendiculatus]